MTLTTRLARLERQAPTPAPTPTRFVVLFPGDPDPEAHDGERHQVVRIVPFDEEGEA